MRGHEMKKCKEYWIYIVLCLVCIAVRVFPLSIGAEYDEAINDIAIGGFASTLVAWIIKVNDNVANEKRNRALGCRALYGLYKSIAEYMDAFVRCMCIQSGTVSKTKINTFVKWNEELSRELNEVDDVTYEVLCNFMDIIESDTNKIISQQDWYVSEGILDVNIIETIGKLANIFLMKENLLKGTAGINNLQIMNNELISCLQDSKELSLGKFVTTDYGFSNRMESHINSDVLKIEV